MAKVESSGTSPLPSENAQKLDSYAFLVACYLYSEMSSSSKNMLLKAAVNQGSLGWLPQFLVFLVVH